jgi:hypothetical protein
MATFVRLSALKKNPMISFPNARRPLLVRLLGVLILLAGGDDLQAQNSGTPDQVDICVYGGTSAGVMAAVQAHQMGRTVVLISPTVHLGGMTSSGLGFTDMGNNRILGGLARDYFHRIWAWYQQDSAWTLEPRSKFGNKGQGGPALNDQLQIAISFEPHVAEAVFRQFITENNIQVVQARLDLKNGAIKDGTRLTGLRTEDGHVYHAAVFIDASYEGDLMAVAGVKYTVGREANAQYGESHNGIQAKGASKNELSPGIDPYVVKGDPKSGLLPGVNADAGGLDGTTDKRVQAYCYRMCLTDLPDNRVMVEKPPGYKDSDYEILFREIEAKPKPDFLKLSRVQNRKTDTNNNGGISTDYIGKADDYPEADYVARARMEEAHKNWQLGLIWTLQNHPRVPQAIRNFYAKWGLAKDEFTDTGNWPPQLYIREARRMIGDYVLTEPLIRDSSSVSRSIGMGAYTLDSHNVQRYVGADHSLRNEGNVEIGVKQPYRIDYGCMVPRAAECQNLLVPVCVSASHIAYGSIRMEPVFMILGQSAGTAAALAVESHLPVQQVDYGKLKSRLVADGQVLD